MSKHQSKQTSKHKKPWNRRARAAHAAVDAAGQETRGQAPRKRASTPDATEPATRSFPEAAAFSANHPRLTEAQRRHRIVCFGESLGLAPMTARVEAVANEIRTPTLPEDERLAGPVPSRQTYTRWVTAWQASGRRLDGLISAPSTGRPRQAMDVGLQEHLHEMILTFPSLGPKALHKEATKYAKQEKKDHGRVVVVPPRSRIRRYKLSIPKKEIASAAFGTKYARAQTAIKAKYPTKAANDLWFVDQVHLRQQIRILQDDPEDPRVGRWIPATPHGVFALDAHCRFPVSHWIKEPTPEDPHFTTFTAPEVAAVIAGGVMPVLAHPDFEQYAIGDPTAFGIDGSGEMKKVKGQLKDLGYTVRDSEPYAAWIRGVIERFFRTLKRGDLERITGNADLYLTFDDGAEPPRHARERTNGDKGTAVPVRHEVPIECLPTIDQFRALVLWALHQHIITNSRAIRGRRPVSLWNETRPPAVDIIPAYVSLFPEHRVQVSTSGVECGPVKYNSQELQEAFALHEKVLVRADPLERGAFVYPLSASTRSRSNGLFVPNRDVWVAELSPEQFSDQIKADYTTVRDTVYSARKKVLGGVIGDAAMQDLARKDAEREKRYKKTSRKQREIDKKIAEKKAREARAARGEAEPSSAPKAKPIPKMPRQFDVDPAARKTRAASAHGPSGAVLAPDGQAVGGPAPASVPDIESPAALEQSPVALPPAPASLNASPIASPTASAPGAPPPSSSPAASPASPPPLAFRRKPRRQVLAVTFNADPVSAPVVSARPVSGPRVPQRQAS